MNLYETICTQTLCIELHGVKMLTFLRKMSEKADVDQEMDLQKRLVKFGSL